MATIVSENGDKLSYSRCFRQLYRKRRQIVAVSGIVARNSDNFSPFSETIVAIFSDYSRQYGQAFSVYILGVWRS